MPPAALLPHDHPLRRELADEVHARPPAAVHAPAVVSFVALTEVDPRQTLRAVSALAARAGRPEPPLDAAHAVIELPEARLKWDLHGEFISLSVVQSLPQLTAQDVLASGKAPSALYALPASWLAGLPGQAIAAGDILVLPFGAEEPRPDAFAQLFSRDALTGASALDEAVWLFTDFMLKDEGRTRWLVLDVRMGRAQTARVVQRIVDIEVYRMTALLAFPLARQSFSTLTRIERELERITAATAALHEDSSSPAAQREERRLLDELSQIASQLERLTSTTAFRFSAGQAYWDLVRARVAEFREQRLGDLRTLGGFLNRRLAPAMNSCAAAARRQEALSARIERASSLLRTRVDIAREEQNQQILSAMERRGKLQLRLQQTVEGLSVAAIAYYTVGLLGYLLKPLQTVLPRFNPEWAVAAAIPLIAVLVWRRMRRLRAQIETD